jgi:hypothetical protein
MQAVVKLVLEARSAHTHSLLAPVQAKLGLHDARPGPLV